MFFVKVLGFSFLDAFNVYDGKEYGPKESVLDCKSKMQRVNLYNKFKWLDY